MKQPTSLKLSKQDVGWRAELLNLVGKTPLARIPLAARPERGFWAKLESLGLGGMKARSAIAILRAAAKRGELTPGARIVETTSGTMGLGLAFAGHALGHPVTLIVDDDLEPEMRTLFTAYGVTLDVVREPYVDDSSQRARLNRLHQVLAEHPGSFWPNQYNNPDNPLGYAGMAHEILDQIDGVDVLVTSVGTGGHSAGLIAVLRSYWPRLHVVGVDAVGSRVFGQPSRPRLMRGIGNTILPGNVAYQGFDEVHWVGPVEIVWSCRDLARRTFVTGGWSTGAAALVAGWYAQHAPVARVLTVFPDGPQRYLRSIFDDAWCERHGLLAQPRTFPVDISEPDWVEVSGWARSRAVRDPALRTAAST